MVELQNKVSFSKRGVACLAECGGGYTKTGAAVCIGDQYGNAKPAIHVPTHGNLCNGDHAFIPVVPGDVVVAVDRHHGDRIDVATYRVLGWDASGNVSYKQIPNQNNGVNEAIYTAAISKVNCYHCREPYYITNADRFNQSIYGKVRYFVGVNLAAETAMVCAYDTKCGRTYQQMCSADGAHTSEVFDDVSKESCFDYLKNNFPTFSIWDRTEHIYGRE